MTQPMQSWSHSICAYTRLTLTPKDKELIDLPTPTELLTTNGFWGRNIFLPLRSPAGSCRYFQIQVTQIILLKFTWSQRERQGERAREEGKEKQKGKEKERKQRQKQQQHHECGRDCPLTSALALWYTLAHTHMHTE